MVRKNSQLGLALIPTVGLVAAILVLGAIAVVGLTSKPKPLIQNHPSPSASASATPVAASTKPGNEFDVTDLGFKLTLPAGLTGLTDIVQQNQTGPGIGLDNYNYSVVYLSNDTLTADDPTNCSTGNGPNTAGLGEIDKYNQDPVGVDQLASPSNTIQVGSFWLSYHAPQSSCSQNAAANSYQTSLIPLVEQAFETASQL